MMSIPLTGDPLTFECPICHRKISAEVGQYGLALSGCCEHKFEVHRTIKGLMAVFK